MSANLKITDLAADTSPSGDDLIETVNDPGGTPVNKKVTLANLLKRLFLADATQLLVTAVADGEFLKRSGTNITSGVPSGTGAETGANSDITSMDALTGALQYPTRVDFSEGSAPSTPAANKVSLYAKADGLLYSKDDAGVETGISTLSTEQVQDIVGAMMSDGGVDFTYDDSGGVITNVIKTVIGIACSDETTAITTGTAKATFRMPHAMTLTAVRASLTTASSSGIPTFDINEGGTTILSTKLTIDASEKTSTTAATPAVISDSALADDAEITIDFDVAGTGAAGVKIWLIGTRA